MKPINGFYQMVELVFLMTDHAKNSFWWLNICDEKRMQSARPTKNQVRDDLGPELKSVRPANQVTLKLNEQ